jgi:hypothetical protein
MFCEKSVIYVSTRSSHSCEKPKPEICVSSRYYNVVVLALRLTRAEGMNGPAGSVERLAAILVVDVKRGFAVATIYSVIGIR